MIARPSVRKAWWMSARISQRMRRCRNQSPARNLLERLQGRAHEALRFADHPKQVPFTQGAAEK
jgi:hypothetical protein